MSIRHGDEVAAVVPPAATDGFALDRDWDPLVMNRSHLTRGTRILMRLVGLAVVVGGLSLLVARTWSKPPDERFVGVRLPPATSTTVLASPESETGRIDASWAWRPAMQEQPFVKELQDEQNAFDMRYVPDDVIGVLMPDYDGEFINTSNGSRATFTAPDCACRPVRVWVVGGSVAFGYGQRDDYTPASWIARAALDDDVPVVVENLAMVGWVLPQGVRAVERRIASGASLPDIVIFLDGWNDTFLSVSAAIGRGELPPDDFEIAGPDIEKMQEIVAAGEESAAVEAVGGRSAIVDFTVERYRRFQAEAHAALDPLGIRTEFFFQPDVTSSTGQEQFIEGIPSSPLAGLSQVPAILEETAAALEPEGVRNLRGVFDDVSSPIFIDTVHVNEAGAELIGRAIYDEIAPVSVAPRR